MNFFPLAPRQFWWMVRSQRTGKHGKFYIWHLVWGETEEEAFKHLADSDTQLDKTLMEHALRRGEISDHSEWTSLSTLLCHTETHKVSTLREIEARDSTLHGMLVEHDCFVHEMSENDPSVIGGGFEFLSDEAGQ
jgi:hypothetical protein